MSVSFLYLLHSLNKQQQHAQIMSIMTVAQARDRIRNRHYHTRCYNTIPLPHQAPWEFVRGSQNDSAFTLTCGLTVSAFNLLHTAFQSEWKW